MLDAQPDRHVVPARAGIAAGRMAGRARPRSTTRRRSPSWSSAPPPSATARRAELVWLVEHPPLYTAGTSAESADLLEPDRFPVFKTGRGGEYTYHGPGQRVAYVMLDLKRRREDVRAFVAALEDWIIGTLGRLQRQGRAARGPRRRLGRAAGQAAACRRRAGRGQDRGDRHPPAALGELSRHRAQRRAGPRAFRRHRALRRRRPRRHQPRRSRPAGDDGRRRRRAAGQLHEGVRAGRRSVISEAIHRASQERCPAWAES